MSHSLWPHGLQHVRLPCPSLSPRVCSSCCPLSRWCHPTILCSVTPFYSSLQSFPASGFFPMRQVFTSGSQHQSFQWIFRVDFLYDWLVWSPCYPRDSQESSQHHSSKAPFFGTQPSLWSKFHICTWLLEKPQLWLYGPLLIKWCLCFLIHCLGLSYLSFKGVSIF